MTAQQRTTETSHQHIDRILHRKEVETITVLSRTTFYEGVAAGTFPNAVKVGAHAVACPESVSRNWLTGRMEGGRA